MSTSPKPDTAVVRRHVFFVSGFDPKGASYYHSLYRSQAALQGALTGVDYGVGKRVRLATGNTQWAVLSAVPGAVPVTTTFEFVRWDDIVRAQWPRRAWDVVRGSARGYAAAVAAARAGKLGRVYRAAPRTLIALIYPALYWLLALGAGLGLGLGAAALARHMPVLATMGMWSPRLIGLAVLVGVMRLALRRERQLNTSWLLRIYSFASDWARGRVPRLNDRIDRLASDIVTRLEDAAIDEVLVVGFSVGSILATSAVARAQLRMAKPLPGRLALMTLGHCVPLLALSPSATSFRTELARVGGRASGWSGVGVTPWAIDWTDFSSPSDWGSFALVDPIVLCLPPAESTDMKTPPRMLSPRFHTLFTPQTYAVLRRDKRALHLQYLKAGELIGAYDFFALTAGPHHLQAFCHKATP